MKACDVNQLGHERWGGTTEGFARHAVSSKGGHNFCKNEEVKEVFGKEPKGFDGFAAD